MAVTRPTYVTREEVADAMDVKLSARNALQIDISIEAGSESVEGLTHRHFYPEITTKYVDWPNYQSTAPWKVYLDAAELADVTTIVPTVTSGGNLIDPTTIFWGNPRYAPPYTYFELNRASSSNFGQGDTPQRDIAITGIFGHKNKTTPAGALAVAMTDATSTTAQITNSAAVGVGDVILVDAERMLVQDRAMVSTGQTQVSGATAKDASDVSLTPSGGTYYVGEVLQLDSEQMLITSIAATLTVIRGWHGTVLAAHTGATIYAPRLLTVERGALGTTAATHLINAIVNRSVYPGLAKQMSLAEALVDMRQRPAGWAVVQGANQAKVANIGAGLPDLRERCYTSFGRKARTRAV